MSSLHANPLIESLEPYDPKYLPARVMISANENTTDVPAEVRAAVLARLADLPFNRYPDPLANDLRDAVARSWGLERGNVIMGNGGDELLFNLALAFGGEGNALLNVPPTFSVYENNAQLTGTAVVNVPRRPDFSIDEEAVIARASQGDIGLVIVTSPNNPTGTLAGRAFVERLLDATRAVVLVDEAYSEFAAPGASVVDMVPAHDNLVVLRTFSKAYALAGVRMGYLLTSPAVVSELTRVRQPYSVDAVSQAIALEVVKHREAFVPVIDRIKAQRTVLFEGINALPGATAYPSEANFLLVKIDDAIDAGAVWQRLFDAGVLVRDFSRGPLTRNCLRVSVGTPEENAVFLSAFADALKG